MDETNNVKTKEMKNKKMRAHRCDHRKIIKKKSHANQKSETWHRQAKREERKKKRSSNEIISMQSHQLTECLRFKNYVPSVSETPAHRFDFFCANPSACSSYCFCMLRRWWSIRSFRTSSHFAIGASNSQHETTGKANACNARAESEELKWASEWENVMILAAKQ